MKSLYETLVLIDSPEEAKAFLLDLCTPHEVSSLSERWTVCQLLDSGKFSYREINRQTGSSTTTISRVARFLNKEQNNGYRSILKKIKERI